MQKGRGPWLLFAASVLLLGCVVHRTEGLAVIAIDIGSEFMKVAIVKPGVPMETVLNKESRRKTSMVVAMRNGERTFSDGAANVAVKFPKMAYRYIHDLLAKTPDNPLVQEFQKRFPYYKIVKNKETGIVEFELDDGSRYSAEELFAMILENAKEFSQAYAEHPISDCVITVPPYWNQAERRALLRAANFAGLKVLQLMNDNAAVALHYGVFRRKSFNSTAQYYMFFDMGASKTVATIVSYQVVRLKSAATGLTDTNPQVTVRGVGFDRGLGGLEFQLRLRDHLAKVFNAQKKASTDVTKNARSMSKLLKEAGRVKNVLSANADHFAQIEGLLEDQDFKAKVTREEFENMCKDLFDRIRDPIEMALKTSGITMGEIKEVILMGGGTRVPKVQEILKKTTGREELGKGINTDEAGALGAVYHAAFLSKGFRVKKFLVKDANLFPIQVEFERAKTNEDGSEVKKGVKRTLFNRMNPFPQKKVMTFNKHFKDFNFVVNYGDLDFMGDRGKQVFGDPNLYEVTLMGVEQAHMKHGDKEAKGVKAHFNMDDNGILNLDRVEAVYEELVKPQEEDGTGGKKDEESTFSKLGSTISNFFGGKKEEKDGKEEGKKKDDKESSVENDNREPPPPPTQESEDKAGKKKTEKDKDEKKKDEQKVEKDDKEKDGKKDKKEEKKDQKKKGKKEGEKEEKKGDKKKEGGKDEGKTEEKKAEEKKEKPQPKAHIIRAPIKVDTRIVDLPEPSKKSLAESKQKIDDLRKKDMEKHLLEKAKNELETFIFDARDKLSQDDYIKSTKESERDLLTARLSEASEWLYEQPDDAKAQIYTDKLAELHKETKDLFFRVREMQERPKALDALKSILNYSESFLAHMKNFTGEDLPYTEVEYTTLEKLINSTKEWRGSMQKEQDATLSTEKPKLLIEDIARKIGDLDREVKYLVNKAKMWKPKVKPEDLNKTAEADGDDKTSDDTLKAQTGGENVEEIKVGPGEGESVKVNFGSDGKAKVEKTSDKEKEEGDGEKEEEGEKEGNGEEEKKEEPQELGSDESKTETPSDSKPNKDKPSDKSSDNAKDSNKKNDEL